MARLTSQLLLRLVDGVTAPARKVVQSVRGITSAIREGNLEQLRALSAANARSLDALQGRLLGAATSFGAFALAVASPIKAAQSFESQMTDIAQKADLTRREAALMGASLRALGPQVNQTASELAKGVDVLAGFGLDPRIAMNMIKPISMAATAYKAEIADIAAASYAAVSNLKVPVEQTGQVLDIMALAGKRGAFELKEMAQYMPSLAAAAQGLGQTGAPAVADLAAALQITRKGTGDSAEAATNLGNLLQKISSPATVRAFKKQNVDLVASLKQLEAEGRTPIEAITELTNKTLGGDLSRLGYLFEDAQVQKALRPLIQNMEEYRSIRADAGRASGVVDTDFAERMRDGAEQARAFKVGLSNLALTIGAALLPALNAGLAVITPVIGALSDMANAHPALTSAIIGTVGAVIAFRLATVSLRFAKAQGKQAMLDLGIAAIDLRKNLRDTTVAIVAGSRNVVGGMLGMAKAAPAAAVAVGQRLSMAFTTAALQSGVFLGSLKAGGVRGFGAAILGLLNPMRLVTAATRLLSLSWRGLLISTGIGALLVIAGLLVEHWRGVVTFFQGFGRGFMAALAPVRPAIQPLIDGVMALVGWLGKLFGDGSGDDWSKFGENVGRALGGVVMHLVNFVRWIGEAISGLGRLFSLGRSGGQPPAPGGAPAPRGGGGRPAVAGKRRWGGDFRSGLDYLVGEAGPEIVRFDQPGRIARNGSQPSGGAGRGSGGRPPVNLNPTFIIQGADADSIVDKCMSRMKGMLSDLAESSFGDSDLRTT